VFPFLAAALAVPPVPTLDARLTSFDYPYDVHTFRVDAQRQALEMSYMDVHPEGSGNGRTVMLLHGKNFSGAYWAPTIEVLHDAGYRVIVPDQIGFGKSSKPEHFQYSFHQLAHLTDQLLVELDVDEVDIVGHSMGGMLATRYALLHPTRAHTLTLVNPIGLEDWQQVVPYQPVEAWFAQEKVKTPQGIRNYMTSAYFDGQWKDAYEPLVTILAGWTAGPDHERIAWTSAQTYDMIFTQPVVHDFDRIAVPTLLIVGERDRTALGRARAAPADRVKMGNYPVLARSAHERIPDSELVLLPGVGHLPQVEVPDETHRALLTFLARRAP